MLITRFFEASRYPELFWVWLTVYAAAVGGFVCLNEFKQCVRAVAESLENKDWGTIREQRIPSGTLTYQRLLDSLVRNMRERQVWFGRDAYYSIDDPSWSKVGAHLLGVGQREVTELQLKHFVAQGLHRQDARYVALPRRVAVGKDDYVPLSRFLLKAA